MLELKHQLKLRKTHDEKARMNLVSRLRAHVLMDMANGMRAVWDADVAPDFRRSHRREPRNGPEVHKAMKPNEYFKFYRPCGSLPTWSGSPCSVRSSGSARPQEQSPGSRPACWTWLTEPEAGLRGATL